MPQKDVKTPPITFICRRLKIVFRLSIRVEATSAGLTVSVEQGSPVQTVMWFEQTQMWHSSFVTVSPSYIAVPSSDVIHGGLHLARGTHSVDEAFL